MIRADIAGTRIALDTAQASPAEVAGIRLVKGVQSVRGEGFVAPLYPDVVETLNRAGVELSPRLQSYLRNAGRLRAYVEEQKSSPARPALIRQMPLKPAFVPYDHQARAYNIAVALLCYANGWEEL